jgi:hypothetical protein
MAQDGHIACTPCVETIEAFFAKLISCTNNNHFNGSKTRKYFVDKILVAVTEMKVMASSAGP